MAHEYRQAEGSDFFTFFDLHHDVRVDRGPTRFLNDFSEPNRLSLHLWIQPPFFVLLSAILTRPLLSDRSGRIRGEVEDDNSRRGDGREEMERRWKKKEGINVPVARSGLGVSSSFSSKA